VKLNDDLMFPGTAPLSRLLSVLVNPGVDPGPTDIHGLTIDMMARARIAV
jgi:hypothetical protein